MTSEQQSRSPGDDATTDDAEKPSSMAHADVANGESPDPVAPDERRGGHETGEQQAQENEENDPPA
jgi:hypothetical protein